MLFAVVFFWTPPHTWALAMRYREDYAAADVPMLPVVATPIATARQILGLLGGHGGQSRWRSGRSPAPAGSTRWPPCCWAPSSSARPPRLLARAHTGADGAALRPMRLFHCSNLYLALLFVAAAVDPLLR